MSNETMVTTKDCFFNGSRIRAGSVFPKCEEYPSYVVKASDYRKKAEPVAEVQVKVPKVDSISDVAMDGSNDVASASKAAIDLAEKFSVNLEDIEGTGASGQITKADVNRFIEKNSAGDEI